MGQSKTGDVYRLDWMALVPLGPDLLNQIVTQGCRRRIRYNGGGLGAVAIYEDSKGQPGCGRVGASGP